MNEKLLKVLEVLSENSHVSQREVAEKTGFSLGMVNLILKRLMTTGYIKVANLNARKMKYILTPMGITEKMSRSYQYFVRAYRTFHESQLRIERMLDHMIQKGHRKFVILGDGEVADMVELVLKNENNKGIAYRRDMTGIKTSANGEIFLDCRRGQEGGSVGISVLEEILNISNKNEVAYS